jgi:hypothetical protein
VHLQRLSDFPSCQPFQSPLGGHKISSLMLNFMIACLLPIIQAIIELHPVYPNMDLYRALIKAGIEAMGANIPLPAKRQSPKRRLRRGIAITLCCRSPIGRVIPTFDHITSGLRIG